MKTKIVRCQIDLRNPPPPTEEQEARLDALANVSDSEIDFSDIPELTENWFAEALPNPYLQQPIETTIQLEERVLSWLRESGDGSPESVEARINAILRRAMLHRETPAREV